MSDIERYGYNKKYFQNIYLEWASDFTSEHLHLAWEKHNEGLLSQLLPAPPLDFLQNQTLRYTMFVDRRGQLLASELDYLESRYNSLELKKLLNESLVGRPTIVSEKYNTSHNSIHHLYHLARYESATDNKISELSSILEWGVGYANMAKIIRRINPRCTYILVDFPLMSALQWLYLVSIFGQDNVNKVTNDNLRIKENLFNIVPLNLVPKISLRAEMFLSTWALSESGEYWQDYVFANNWFGAEKLLLSFQQGDKVFANSERVGSLAQKSGATIEKLEVIQNNSYAFK